MSEKQKWKGRVMSSPVGGLILLASEEGLTGLHFEDGFQGDSWIKGESSFLDQAERELNEYFAGKRESFDVPIDLHGTDFQLSVWEALKTIPFGEVVSYQFIADQIENPRAVRAVGLANGRNPISIIVPCHRVIGANGKLTGYGGGVDRKWHLLVHEKAGIFC